MDECCAVVDLRQYTLHPGQRDALIDVFDEHFVEGQEAAGMHIVGQFRDLDDPDRFVWIRGFADLPTRAEALERLLRRPGLARARRHREHDDDRLRQRPAAQAARARAPATPAWTQRVRRVGTTDIPGSIVAGAVYHRGRRRRRLRRVLHRSRRTGADRDRCASRWPSSRHWLPRTTFRRCRCATRSCSPGSPGSTTTRRTTTIAARLASSPVWQRQVLPELVCRSVAPAQELRLRPTPPRSQLR